MSHYCEKCGRTMEDKMFYTSYNTEKYPDGGKLNQCKKCITMHIDNWDPETYTWILKEIDVPYIPSVWNKILQMQLDNGKTITSMTVLGKYLSTMKLKQHKDERWADTERLQAEEEEKKKTNMRAQGYSGEEIEQQLAIDRTPPKPKDLIPPPPAQPSGDEFSFTLEDDTSDEESSIADQLTDEDKLMLRLKWGKGYTPAEWVRMEQLYDDFMQSYDIQSAGHKDTLIMICKSSLKANQCIDCGDIDGFQKMQRAYDSLMKSGKFQAVQTKGESDNVVDSIGELVAMCERDGFIPRYYVDTPKDKVDRTLQDLQTYTKTLVTEEANLGNMIEAAIKKIEQDRERESQIDVEEGDEDMEEQLFSDDSKKALLDEDYTAFNDFEEEQAKADEAALLALLGGDINGTS